MTNKGNKYDAMNIQKALLQNVTFDGTDEGYELWNDVRSIIREESFKQRSIDFVRLNGYEWPLIESEKPDVIFESVEYVLGIECFLFDSSQKTKKGSKLRRKKDDIEREIMDEYRRTNKKHICKECNLEYSYDFYLNSARESLAKHKESIPFYKKNLKDRFPGKKIILVFFIEDTTTFGNYTLKDGKYIPINILNDKEFLEDIKTCANLDFIISTYQYDYYRYATTILENKNEIITKRMELLNDSKPVLITEKESISASFGFGIKCDADT